MDGVGSSALTTIEELARTSAEFARQLAKFPNPPEALRALTDVAVEVISGAEYAAITRGVTGHFETVAATDQLARDVDAIQYDLRSGPCVDAILENAVFRTNDLRDDERWPTFGRRAAAIGILSMLSVRLYLEDTDVIAALNIYSRQADAFDESSQTVGMLLASHAALALGGVLAQQRVANLERALASNREIGVAMGILMARHAVTREQAFDLLRIASQNTNRKLVAIATDVADTGALDLPPTGGRTRPNPRSAAT